MTEDDKEKAEEYSHRTRVKDENTYPSFDDECISEVQDYEGNYIYFYNRIEKAYLDGLAEGRKLGKEEQWKATEKAQKKTSARIRELEKENAELNEKIKGFESGEVAWQGDMDETIKQNLELKEQNKAILEDNDELNKWIDELKTQNEKMKSLIYSEIDFCMYCPLTNECRNDEGTCPYADVPEEEQKNILMDFIKIGSYQNE